MEGSTKILLSNNGHQHNIVGMKRKSMTPTNNNNHMLSNNGNMMSSYMNGNGMNHHSYSNGNNSWPTIVSNNSNPTGNITPVGVVVQSCSKCGGKKRHSKTCIYRREDEGDAIVPSKDVIQRLDVAALKRYKKHYRLKTKHNSSKAELASIVRSHFDGLPVNEGEIIENFMFKVKNVPTI
ncbi:hypothetical protein DICPUDRAFT_153440 [Dictyostelium purpureum]|uniref:Histone deacetylase complex subunit SAP30 Sin3 binding domain-containing protein n=1 Tax=Dictyostelium purpureum TaxID=5786 RepID=F0ZNX1_DICPU|nr:uncharacterized protein DICPUDRAFT_153440 [Dictyostelium purpureum]EGC34383.1 hypothetical protein DICPUDRAFT_153440 [Dictyostelium purpureum]|eukprot:XP_003289117.1 hypothetical protein DICPUDRAFT_153440 [Dictyostelium purpureum]